MKNLKIFIKKHALAIGACATTIVFLGFWIVFASGLTTIGENVVISGELTADNNTLSNCEWTAATCDDAVSCPAGKFVVGVQRHTGLSLCGVDPNHWYQQSVYCCNL
jgi:hypothetical protein